MASFIEINKNITENTFEQEENNTLTHFKLNDNDNNINISSNINNNINI